METHRTSVGSMTAPAGTSGTSGTSLASSSHDNYTLTLEDPKAIYGSLAGQYPNLSSLNITDSVLENPAESLDLPTVFFDENPDDRGRLQKKKIYYGTVKTMSQDDPGADSSATDAPESRLNIYAFLQQFKTDKVSHVPNKKHPAVKSVPNQHHSTVANEETLMSFLKRKLIPNRELLYGSLKDHNKPTHRTEQYHSKELSNSTTNGEDHKLGYSDSAVRPPPSVEKTSNSEDSRWRQYTELLMGLVRNPEFAAEMMSKSSGAYNNYSQSLEVAKGRQFSKYNSVLANWTSEY